MVVTQFLYSDHCHGGHRTLPPYENSAVCSIKNKAVFLKLWSFNYELVRIMITGRLRPTVVNCSNSPASTSNFQLGKCSICGEEGLECNHHVVGLPCKTVYSGILTCVSVGREMLLPWYHLLTCQMLLLWTEFIGCVLSIFLFDKCGILSTLNSIHRIRF